MKNDCLRSIEGEMNEFAINLEYVSKENRAVVLSTDGLIPVDFDDAILGQYSAPSAQRANFDLGKFSFDPAPKFLDTTGGASCEDETFDTYDNIMKIVREQESKVCDSTCGVPTDNCFVMTFYTSDIAHGFVQKCLDLPAYSSFFSSESYCPAKEGYSIIDSEDKIPFGEYVIEDVSKEGETWPAICMYRKE